MQAHVRQHAKLQCERGVSACEAAAQAAAAAGGRELDREGALAVLLSHAVQYTVRGSAISLGRNTGSCGQVGFPVQSLPFNFFLRQTLR